MGDAIVAPIGEKNDPERAKAIADHRHDDAGQQEEHDLVPFAVGEMRKQHAHRDRGDQEAQARAGLGHLETAVRQFDDVAFGVMEDADQREAGRNELRREELQAAR